MTVTTDAARRTEGRSVSPKVPWWRHKNTLAYALVAVPLVVLAIALLLPVGFNAWVSLHSWSLVDQGGPKFIGLGNYEQIFTDPRYRGTVLRTFVFVVGTVGVQLIVGFAMALFLNRHFRTLKALRTVLLLPMMVSEVVVGMAWRYMYEYSGGALNWLLSLVGLGPVHWLGPDLALLSIIFADAWSNIPFVTLILFTALQTVPRDILDAAAVDGAQRWTRLRHVIIPMVQPAILVVLMFRTMFAIRAFTLVWILTEGGPGGTTNLIAIDVYKSAFSNYNLGLGGALSWVLVAISLVIAILYIRWLNREPLY
ncbi:MAG: ABC transporter permease subunit [Streptosporangiales bacterium]|nr:ABC transporter permease subunit [Streptosporangiales bacterium]